MKLRKSVINIASSPVLTKAIEALARSSVRAVLKDVGAITPITDNSTGTPAGALVAVNTQDAKVSPSGSNLVNRAALNTALGKINNACAVVADHLNNNGFLVLGADVFGEGNGTIVTPGTIAACDKTATAEDEDGEKATGVLTGAGVIADGDTVTIGAKVYTFQDTLTNVDGNVKVGADLQASLANLRDAINLGATAGTDYATAMTAHPTVTCTAATATTLTVTAIDGGTGGNAIASTETGANISWGAATLTGGTTTSGACLRSEFNSAIIVARNNVSTLVAAYNELAYAIGVAQLTNATKGLASPTRELDNAVTATTVVTEAEADTADLASSAAANAALTAIVNNIATIAGKIDNPLFLTATFDPIADHAVVLIP